MCMASLLDGVVVQLNIGLFLFNLLLPAYPLDGGRIFADLLLICGVDPVVAAKITVSVAFIVTILIILYGLYRQMLLTVAVSFRALSLVCLPLCVNK